MKIRTLIVDDEPLARERLRALLEKESGIDVIGECATGPEALERIQRDTPDLVFLDVQMPEMDGLEVVKSLEMDRPPVIIFVTAYNQFALQAFEVNALDYLTKPFDRDRFQKALRRAIGQISRAESENLSERLAALIAEVGPESKGAGRIAVKIDGRVLLVRFEEIDWIEAADNYVSIHTGKQACLHRETLTALEARLPARKFVRISRSAIVNVDQIQELQPMFHGDYVVFLRNGAKVNLSRSYRAKLNQILGKLD